MYCSVFDLTCNGDWLLNLGTSKAYNSNVNVLVFAVIPGDANGLRNTNGYLIFWELASK